MKSWIIAVLMLCSASTAPAASLYYWTDYQGVKHISDRLPVEEAEIEIMEIKDPTRDGSEAVSANQSGAIDRLLLHYEMKELRQKIGDMQRDATIRGNQLEQDYKIHARKRENERELKATRGKVEFYQDNKDRYRRNENNAPTEDLRLFWKGLNDKGEAQERKLRDLESQ